MKKLFYLGIMFIVSNTIYSQAGNLDATFGIGGKVIT